jgi:hypothetical protein
VIHVIHGGWKELIYILAIYEDIDDKGKQILLAIAESERAIRNRGHIGMLNVEEMILEVYAACWRSFGLYMLY